MHTNIKKIVFPLVLGSTLLIANSALVTPTVKAAKKEHSCIFVPINSPIRTNWEKSCEIPKFDSSLGNLTKVNVFLKGQISASMNVKNGDPSPRNGTTTTTGNIVVKTPNGDSLTVAPSISYTDTLQPCEQNCGDTAKSIAPTLDTTPTPAQKNYPLSYGFKDASNALTKSLESFVGTGVVSFVGTAQAASSTTFGGNYSLNGLANAAAELTVAYEYNSKPIAESGEFTNNTPGTNVNLSGSLKGKAEIGTINYHVIKSLPNAEVCELFLSESLVKLGQIIEVSNVGKLLCKPSNMSEGKSTSFDYVSVDSQGVESNPATINVKLFKSTPKIEAPSVDATLAPTLKTTDCSISAKQGEQTAIQNCLKTVSGEPKYYKIFDIRVGKSNEGVCGEFLLNGVKVVEGQKILTTDSEKIIFGSTTKDCKECNVGFSFVAVDKDENESNPSKVNVNLGCQMPIVEATLARTGGEEQGNIKEMLVLITVLLGSIAFFFSTLSTESIKKMFTRN